MALYQYIIVSSLAVALLTLLILLAYKVMLGDFKWMSLSGLRREFRAVYYLGIGAAFVSLIPTALFKQESFSSDFELYAVMSVPIIYFAMAVLYRKTFEHPAKDFLIDTGSKLNQRMGDSSAIVHRVWLFLTSWAGLLIFGLTLGFVINYNLWKDNKEWITDQPSDFEARMYLLIFAGFIVAAMAAVLVLRNKRFRKYPTSKRLRRAFVRSWMLPSFFGLIIAFLQDFTRNATATNRYFVIIPLILIVLMTLWHIVFTLPNARRHLAEDREFFESRQKTLRRQRNKKRRKKRKK